MNNANIQMIDQLQQVKAEIKRLQEIEYDLVYNTASIYGTDADHGSRTTQLDDGRKIVVVKPITYKVHNDENQAMSWCKSLPVDVAMKYVKWSPSLNVKEFKALETAVASEKALGQDDSISAKLLRSLEAIISTKTDGKPQVKIQPVE